MMKVALIYDFDGTLANSNIQESSFIPSVGMCKTAFWNLAEARAKEKDMESVLAYMTLMLDKANEKNQKITVDYLREHGKQHDEKLFEGLAGKDNWFCSLKKMAQKKFPEVILEHYIISAGIKEMIEGSSIAHQFEHIYASSFMYDKDGLAQYPAVVVNYTGKTQFLYRINKGVKEVYNDHDVNKYVPKEARPVPFEHMIYIGDGLTDVPAMKMVSDKGGFTIGVYGKGTKHVKKMFHDKRIDYYCKADYSRDTDLFKIVNLRISQLYYRWKISQEVELLNPPPANQ
ncbi:MAG: HAD family hydrolase [Spirochaetia bacterium]